MSIRPGSTNIPANRRSAPGTGSPVTVTIRPPESAIVRCAVRSFPGFTIVTSASVRSACAGTARGGRRYAHTTRPTHATASATSTSATRSSVRRKRRTRESAAAQDVARQRAGVAALVEDDLAVHDRGDIAVGADDVAPGAAGEVAHEARPGAAEPARVEDDEIGGGSFAHDAAVGEPVHDG